MKSGPTPEQILVRLKERFPVECETADPAALDTGAAQVKTAADQHIDFLRKPKIGR